MHISAPLDSENFHNTTDGATQALDLMACPECSMTAELRWDNRVESTDGPVDHVRITCVNRHWFLMPADSLAFEEPIG
jgi:hypothetical protein